MVVTDQRHEPGSGPAYSIQKNVFIWLAVVEMESKERHFQAGIVLPQNYATENILMD